MPEYVPIFEGARAAVLIVALAVDFMIGWVPSGARGLAIPSRAIGACFAWLESKLNRPQRSHATRWLRGAFVISLAVAAAAAAALALSNTGQGPIRWPVEGAFILLLLRGREILANLGGVGRTLRTQGADAARAALARAAFRETRDLDDHAVARGVIELAAQRFIDGLVGPAVWYLLAGLPGFLLYCGVSLCVERTAPYHRPSEPFGEAPRAVKFVLDILAAPCGGLLLTLAALFVPGSNAWRALRTMAAEARRYRAYGAGWTVAAAAGALGLALGGPRRFGNAADSRAWVGQGRARAHGIDVQRTLYLVVVGSVLFAASLGIVALSTAP